MKRRREKQNPWNEHGELHCRRGECLTHRGDWNFSGLEKKEASKIAIPTPATISPTSIEGLCESGRLALIEAGDQPPSVDVSATSS